MYCIQPQATLASSDGYWKNAKSMVLTSNGNSMILNLDKDSQEDRQTLVSLCLTTHKVHHKKLESPKEYVYSMAANDEHLIAVIHTNLYSSGMASTQYNELKQTTPVDHIQIYDVNDLSLQAKIEWKNADRIQLHPNGNGLAIAADKNSVYLDDYRVLLREI